MGVKPAGGGERVPPRRLPSLEPAPAGQTRTAARIARRAGMAVAAIAALAGSYLALQHIGLDRIGHSLVTSSPSWVLIGLALMCVSMLFRAVSWHAILRAALPDMRPRLADAWQGTAVGVLMSATLPARLGEPSRALIVARRLGRPREALPVVVGTLVSQTLLNVLALVILGVVMFSTVGLFAGKEQALIWYAAAPVAVVALVLLAPALVRSGLPSRSARVARWMRMARAAATRVRHGLIVFRRPRLGTAAVTMQLTAWFLQLISCYVLMVALGLDGGAADLGAAAAVLFAVNVSAVLPLTPSNIGVFQAACVLVLNRAYGVGYADALAYGIILQAVEVAAAVILGAPALVKEGMSWREVRLRALHTSPVELSSVPAGRRSARATRVLAGEDRADPVELRARAGDQLLGLRAQPREVRGARVVQVVGRDLELGLQPDVAIAHQGPGLELDRVGDPVEDHVEHRAAPTRAAPTSASARTCTAACARRCRATASAAGRPPARRARRRRRRTSPG